MKRVVIVGKCERYIVQYIANNGFSIIYSIENNKADDRLKYHADLSILRLNEKSFAVLDFQDRLISYLEKNGFSTYRIKTSDSSTYPDDCRLNFSIIKNNAFGSRKALTSELIRAFEDNEILFNKVNQGYAKCSTINLNDAIITDDKTIYNAVRNKDIDCLLVKKGDVQLQGFDYGFIGGASFVDNEYNTIYFFGDIREHTSYYQIRDFAAKHNYAIRFIPDKPLTDIGGAIII